MPFDAGSVECHYFLDLSRLQAAAAEMRAALAALTDAGLSEVISEDRDAEERRWADAFARSQDVLARLADEARAERRAGRTLPLDTILDEEICDAPDR